MTKQEIIELLKDHTQAEVARLSGYTRQYINQIAIASGSSGPRYGENKHKDFIPLLGTCEDTQLSRVFEVPNSTVAALRHRLGIQPYYKTRPDRCELCDTKPYAKGMCHRCWERNRRKVRKNEITY